MAAERSYVVKLVANTSAYISGMKRAEQATEDLSSKGKRDLDQLGASMQNVGTKATLGVSIPLIGVGAAAVSMSNDFDASMSKIVGLVGLSADEVDGMKESVLALSGETARSPQELADALFVVTSAGLRGEDALDALEYAAKGAAAGLGETKDIARAVSGVMNAYGPDVIDAAEATDILTATARAGNFETSQLAGSLGRVLPFANSAGAAFEEVGGAVALLTRVNGDAAQSITQVSALMQGFVTPTAEAQKILDELGLTSAQLRDHLGSNGLVSTLELLDDKLGGNQEKFSLLLGGSEAASAAIRILDADAETLAGTFGVTAEAAGMTGEAFGAAAETDAFKMQQAMNDLKVALVEVGAVIGPIVADVAGGVSDLAGAFSDLDPTLQKIVIGIAGAAAAAGPLLIVTGSLVRSYATLRTTMAATNVTMTGSASAMRGLATAAGIAVAALGSARAVSAGLKDDTEWLYDDVAWFEKPFQLAGRFGDALGRGEWGVKPPTVEWREFAEEAAAAFETMTEGVYTTEQLKERLDESSLSLQARGMIMSEFGEGLDRQAEAEANLAEATGLTTEATDEQAASLSTASEAAGIIAREIDLAEANVARFGTDGVENMGAVETATDEAQTAAERLQEQTDRNATSMEEWEGHVEKVIAAHQRLVDEVLADIAGLFSFEQAVIGMENAYLDFEEQIADTTETLNDSESTDRDKERALNDLRIAETQLAEKAYDTAGAYAEQEGAIEGSREWADLMTESLYEQRQEYPYLKEEIDAYIGKLAEIPENVDTTIGITTYYREMGGTTVPYQPDWMQEFDPTQPVGSFAGTWDVPISNGAMIPVTSGSLTPGSSGGNTYNITVESGLISDPVEQGREVERVLRAAGAI